MVVYLIGAGPGDADLITLKAVKALNKADVVLYDYLANEEILAHAPEDAEKIYVGKKAGQHYKTQDQINELIVQQAKAHENVVRLKGGDPFVFGRGGEEILALMENDIKFEVIPGVTSAIGAPTSLNTAEIMKYRDKQTPVCVIESGTLPDENVIFGTLENISEKDIQTPAILIIGEVVKLYKDIYNY